ncbi:TetR/AcrR family transcriptional regulator [Sneathiella sp. HT1-7]|uniref:TetR/AcrR family transcriptional regulator n=1 Tax=Sneathiella sp. HT1-7 TaxID=2887192 RepID=UPI001D15831B|nr:TetR/AcrR family transcriptional regulator [Sneathiella sp. HT1-7]MCC3303223.1 TetR/AcrR family transcriptional regulator [Sneathiella sp. HT1-7]
MALSCLDEATLDITSPQRNGKRRRQEDRRAETRQRLVDATIMLLHEKGAGELTMADVARKAGLTRGAIQYHFDSPKSLLVASIEEIANRLSQHLDAAELTILPLKERIDRIVDDYWQGFSGFNYTAFIEIAVRGRQDPAFEDAITMALEDLEKERAIVWQAVFADTGRSQEEIQSWRQMLLITLRGLALTNIVAGKNEKVSLQIDQFKAMFKRYLTEA